MTLAKHNKMLSHHDKFVEYIHHIENAKHQVLHNQIEEMKQLAAAGQKSNQRYHDLTYIVNESEEEIEQNLISTALYDLTAAEVTVLQNMEDEMVQEQDELAQTAMEADSPA